MNQRLQRMIGTILLGLLFPCLAAAQEGRVAGSSGRGISSPTSLGEEKGLSGGLWDLFTSFFWDRAGEGENTSPRESGKSLLDFLGPWCPPPPLDNRGTIDPDGNP